MVARKQTNVSAMAADSCRASSLRGATAPTSPAVSNAPIRSPKHTAAIAVQQRLCLRSIDVNKQGMKVFGALGYMDPQSYFYPTGGPGYHSRKKLKSQMPVGELNSILQFSSVQ